jgi:hypothetical protein
MQHLSCKNLTLTRINAHPAHMVLVFLAGVSPAAGSRPLPALRVAQRGLDAAAPLYAQKNKNHMGSDNRL